MYAGSMTGRQPTWDERIIERMKPGVDATLVKESLRLTPTERLARLQRMLQFVAAVRPGYRDAVPRPPRNP